MRRTGVTLPKLPTTKISSASSKSAKLSDVSSAALPSSRNSFSTRCRVTPLRKLPLAIGVITTPSLAMKILAVASSATLPSMSPRARLHQGARIVGIEAARLGVDRYRLGGRLAIGRARDRDAARLRQRRFVDRQQEAGRIGIGR